MNFAVFTFRTLRSTFSFRRFISHILILVLLSQTTWASPQLLGMYVDIAAGWKQELRFRYYAGDWASLFLTMLQGKLDDRPTKPNEKPQEKQEDREAMVTKLQLFPAGNITLQTAEPIAFSALTLTNEGAVVSGVKLKWTVEDVSPDKDRRKGKPLITDRGMFFSPIAGDYLITVTGAQFQTSTKVKVVGDPQPPLNKLIKKYKPFS